LPCTNNARKKHFVNLRRSVANIVSSADFSYGGVFFQFKAGKVAEIFIGGAAERVSSAPPAW
jgi:hypothetical protein